MNPDETGIVLPVMQFHTEFIPEGAAAVKWKLCINIGDAHLIRQRFGGWPDRAVPPLVLDALYSGTQPEAIAGFAEMIDGMVKPLFPYLDESEGKRLEVAFASSKEVAYPPFREFLERERKASPLALDAVSVILQTNLIFALRARERETGVWDKRTTGQKTGAIFALGSHMPVTFTRVYALIVGENMRFLFPWGGAYNEYNKILYMMEDVYTSWMLGTADDDLRILLGGLVSRPLTILELIDTSRTSQLQPLARLRVDASPPGPVTASIERFRDVSWAIARGFDDSLARTLKTWKTGRFAYLDGPGDYLEMAYSVAVGLLLKWAMEDGLLLPPPELYAWGDNWRVRKTILETVTRRVPRFHGMHVIRGADVVWQAMLAVGEDLLGRSVQ